MFADIPPNTQVHTHKKHDTSSSSKPKPRLTRANAKAIKFIKQLCSTVVNGLRLAGRADIVAELQAFASAAKVSLNDMVLVHLSYEAYSGCTSVVCLNERGFVN